MNKRQPLKPGARPVGPVYGDTWADIEREARRVTNLPYGHVELDQYYSGRMEKTFNHKDDVPKPIYYANVIVTPVPPKLRVEPEPVKGVEYFSLEDLHRALSDLNYYGTDHIIDKVRRQLSVRDDGRFSVEEIKKATRDVQGVYGIGGTSSDNFIDKVARQARKNRVFDAHTS